VAMDELDSWEERELDLAAKGLKKQGNGPQKRQLKSKSNQAKSKIEQSDLMEEVHADLPLDGTHVNIIHNAIHGLAETHAPSKPRNVCSLQPASHSALQN